MIKLRPDQKRALKKIDAGFDKANRGQLHAPCGWGKSAVQPKIAQKLGARTTVIFVPSLRLITQTASFWLANAGFVFESLLVCSRADAGPDEDIPNFEGYDVTTNRNEVRSFLRKTGRRIIFCTYQSAHKLLGLHFDLGIFDEAHRTAGLQSKTWSVGLVNKNIKIKKRLFMTATPRIIDVGENDRAVVFSMDDEKTYGEIFYEMSFKKAVELDLIVPFQVIVMGPDDSIRKLLIDKKKNHNARAACGVHLLQKARERYGFKRTLSFHSRVALATAFAEDGHRLYAGTKWHVVSAKSSADDRARGEQILSSSRGGVVTNVRVLAEGVDVRDIDSIIFIDPRRSVVDIIQSVGRAMRKPLLHPKEKATIVIPLAIDGDHVEDLSGSFTAIGRIIGALLSIDETIKDHLKKGIGGTAARTYGPVVIDLPKNASAALVSAITTKILRVVGLHWHAMFKRVSESKKAPVIGSDLYEWVRFQRRRFKGARDAGSPLSIEERELLESVSWWSWDTRADIVLKHNKAAGALLDWFREKGSWPLNHTALGRFRKMICHQKVRLEPGLREELVRAGCFENQKLMPYRKRLQRLLQTIKDRNGIAPPQSTPEGVMLNNLRQGAAGQLAPDLVREVFEALRVTGKDASRANMSETINRRFFHELESFLKTGHTLPTKKDTYLCQALSNRRRWKKDPLAFFQRISKLESICAKYVSGYVWGVTMFDEKTLIAAGVKPPKGHKKRTRKAEQLLQDINEQRGSGVLN